MRLPANPLPVAYTSHLDFRFDCNPFSGGYRSPKSIRYLVPKESVVELVRRTKILSLLDKNARTIVDELVDHERPEASKKTGDDDETGSTQKDSEQRKK